ACLSRSMSMSWWRINTAANADSVVPAIQLAQPGSLATTSHSRPKSRRAASQYTAPTRTPPANTVQAATMQIVNQPTLPDPELAVMTIAPPAVATRANANTSRERIRNNGTAAATPINTPGMASAGLNGILMNSPSTISAVNAARLSHRDKPVSA